MAKGSSFERELAKELSLWWTTQERDDIFWRSDQSGGRATQRAKGGKKTAGSYGDLGLLDPIGQPFINLFCCEFKRGYGGQKRITKTKEIEKVLRSKMPMEKRIKKVRNFIAKARVKSQLSLTDIMDADKKGLTFIDFWLQCSRDRKLSDRPYALLIYRRDARRAIAVISTILFHRISNIEGPYRSNRLHIHGSWQDKFLRVTVLELDSFLDWMKPTTIGGLEKWQEHGSGRRKRRRTRTPS